MQSLIADLPAGTVRMKPLLLASALLLTAAAPAPHRWAIGGVPAERSSVTFVDLSALQRSGTGVRAALLTVRRDPVEAGGKRILYSAIDAAIDCQARTLVFQRVRSFSPEAALVDDLQQPGPALPLPAGSSFAATADVACSGQVRAADAPVFASEAQAVDYAQRLLHDQRPTDRAL